MHVFWPSSQKNLQFSEYSVDYRNITIDEFCKKKLGNEIRNYNINVCI